MRKLEQANRAREYYKKATKLDPNLAEAWLGIGITLQNDERWFEATHYIKKAIELNKEVAEFWFALGDAEYHLENLVAAENAYQKVIDLEPENEEIWLEYSHLLMVDNRPDEAIRLLELGMVKHPENAEFIFRFACYHYKTGRLAESYRILAEALEKNWRIASVIFEYVPTMENDKFILELIDTYSKRV